MDGHDARKPNAPCVQGRMAKFMEPCLLLLLRGQRSHGYELMERLGDLGFEGTSSDMATLYRTLRQLEDDGMVLSEWEEGSQGCLLYTSSRVNSPVHAESSRHNTKGYT